MSKSVKEETRTQDDIIFPSTGVGLVGVGLVVEPELIEARRREIKQRTSVY